MKKQVFKQEEIKSLPAIINYLEPKKIASDTQLKNIVFPIWSSKLNSNTYCLSSYKPISKMLPVQNEI